MFTPGKPSSVVVAGDTRDLYSTHNTSTAVVTRARVELGALSVVHLLA